MSHKIKRIGTVGKHQQGVIYSTEGISPAMPAGSKGSAPYTMKILVASAKATFLKRRRNSLGKAMRKQYERGETDLTMKDIRDWMTVEQGESNTLSGAPIDNLIVEESNKKIKIYKGGDAKLHQPTDICQSLEAGTSGGGGTSNRPMIIEENKQNRWKGTPYNVLKPEGMASSLRPSAQSKRSEQDNFVAVENKIKVAIKHKSGKVPQGYSSMNSVFDPEGISPTLRSIEDKGKMILAPNNFKHKAKDGTATREHYLTNMVPSLQANAGQTQGSFVVEDFYRGRKPRVFKEAPALRSGRQGLKVVEGSRLLRKVGNQDRWVEDKEAPSLRGMARMNNVPRIVELDSSQSGPMTMTGTPARSIGNSMEAKNSMRVTSMQLTLHPFLTSTSSQAECPARLGLLREKEEALRTCVERFGSRSSEYLRQNSRLFSYLRTLKASFHTIRENLSK